jgi:hypothetical protein
MVTIKKSILICKDSFQGLFSILTIPDKVLIIFIAILSIILHFFLHINSQSKEAEIIFRGKIIGRYNLKQERVIPIADGITVEIKAGKARLSEDTSPRQIGVNQGWSNHIPIVSIPSELIIKFSKNEEEMLITY